MRLRWNLIAVGMFLGAAARVSAATISCTVELSANKTNVCVGDPVTINVNSTLCRNGVTVASNATYSVSYSTPGIHTVSNQCTACGESSSWSFLNIYVSEVSNLSPASVTMCPGCYTTFTAGGNPTNFPCDPTWSVSPSNAGTVLSVGNTATFALSATYTNGTATLYAVCDTTNSATITVATSEMLAIITQPVSQVVCPGQTVAVSIGATGNSLSYQWRWNGINLTNGGSISGATTPTLTISNVVSDTGVSGTVPANASSGQTFGSLVAGNTYTYAATGCVNFASGQWDNPDGNRSTNTCSALDVEGMVGGYSGFVCAGLTNWSLVGKVGSSCTQFGSAGRFQAGLSGTLTLYCNDQTSGFSDNSGSWNVFITNTVQGTYDVIVTSDCGSKISTGANLWVSTPCDGIPDWWRAQYFGGSGTTTTSQSCATCDPDQDGVSTLQEYQRGTNPTNSASVNIIVYADVGMGNDSYDGYAATVGGGHGPKQGIQAAISTAISNDIVQVAAGMYTSTTFNLQGHNITVRASGPVTVQ